MITHKTKRELDFYPTDPRWVEVLLRHEKFNGVISEPCCGMGDISEALKDLGYGVSSTDIKDYGYGGVKDALWFNHHDNVVTNPPYLIAEQLIKHWLKTTKRKVAVLMRLGFLEGKLRYKQFENIRPNRMILIPERMKHMDNSGRIVSSQFPHIWLIWDRSVPDVNESVMIWDSID